MARSRRRNGRCEFSTRLFSQRPVSCLGADPQSLSHFADRATSLNNVGHRFLLELIRKPNSFTHIRLSLAPKLPSKATINLGAPHPSKYR